MIGVVVRNSTGTTQTRYFHTDRLGSITAITNESATVVERLSYNAWGKRRNADGTTDTAGTLVGQTTAYGFTGEEHLDEVGLVHLNGRIYNPDIGRFTSADPFVPDWTNSQSFNRYSYVRNNPLKYVDPSGFMEMSAGGSTDGLNVWSGTPYSTNPFGCCTATEWKLAGTTAGPPEGGSELSFYAGDPWRNNGVSYQPLSGGAVAISGGSPTQVTATTTTTTTSTGGTTTTSVTYTVTQCSGACNTPPPPPATLGPTISLGFSGATVNAFSPTAVSPVMGSLLGNWWERSVAGFQSESVTDFANRALQAALPGGAGAVAAAASLVSVVRTGAAAQRGVSVLGHHPGYIKYAESIGARYFKTIPREIVERMGPAELRAANTRFLDRLIARGDIVQLSTPAAQARAGSTFAWELQYLQSQGYRLTADGMRMLPPGL